MYLSRDGLIYAYASLYDLGFMLTRWFNIPYGSLSAAMTQDVNDRTQLASFRQSGLVIGIANNWCDLMPIVPAI